MVFLPENSVFEYFKKEVFVIKKVFFKSNIDLYIGLFGFFRKKWERNPCF